MNPTDAELMQKLPVPPELVAWAKETSDPAETVALLAEARAEGGHDLSDIYPLLEAIVAEAE